MKARCQHSATKLIVFVCQEHPSEEKEEAEDQSDEDLVLQRMILEVRAKGALPLGDASEFVEDLHQLLVSLSKEMLDTGSIACEDCCKRQSEPNHQRLMTVSRRHLKKHSDQVFNDHLQYLRQRYLDDPPDADSIKSSSQGLVGVTQEVFDTRMEQLTSFYERLEPSKVKDVQDILSKYR